MDERAALALVNEQLPHAGDDAAIVGDMLITTDMLHERTDFPPGTTRYTAGWRSIGASLSDVAAMGGAAVAAVAVYAAPAFDPTALQSFLDGAVDVCEAVDAEYVGGDLDSHDEFTVASTVVGRCENPVSRGGASPGEVVCVTGTLGRSLAALEAFETGALERANELFRFQPRVSAGRRIVPDATAMMDSSDGLARSLHQLAEASGCGFAIERDRIPVDEAVTEALDDGAVALDRTIAFGEDFELVFTASEDAVEEIRARVSTSVDVTVLGRVTDSDSEVTIDGEALPDEGYTHG